MKMQIRKLFTAGKVSGVMRPLMGRLATGSLAIGYLTMAAPAVYACSCVMPPAPKAALEKSAAVFTGKVVSVEVKVRDTERDAGFDKEVRLQVGQSWKGESSGFVTVTTPTVSSACGVNFEMDKEYLVYAYASEDQPHLFTHTCTRTKRIEAAKDDLTELGVASATPGIAQPPVKPADKPIPPQQSEIEMLRAKVKQQEDEIKFWRGLATGDGTNALRAPFGRFLLVKGNEHCLALQVVEHLNTTDTKKAATRYRWYLQADGSMDFSKANVQKGMGELSEYRGGTWNGDDSIKHGAFDLKWSASDWIYFPYGKKQIRMAITQWVRPEDIKVNDSKLKWRSASQQP